MAPVTTPFAWHSEKASKTAQSHLTDDQLRFFGLSVPFWRCVTIFAPMHGQFPNHNRTDLVCGVERREEAGET
ncbi:hypothetical protein ANI02nite_13110 [Acetobacter nitrogenifigens DSM 23921 = NBRC 105050]|uniref:Uncharacterized protein n=1 Tax=Acetobacter nitrogenifigens DSM 23921 = NBRC 105050 TaxID=1120919 RepID=A0A511X908_9PROT|nr:hypothetical protein ANI02nite_13110 [Acetobacter nitrogenifigens DSM 23921 = NBRC 105050]